MAAALLPAAVGLPVGSQPKRLSAAPPPSPREAEAVDDDTKSVASDRSSGHATAIAFGDPAVAAARLRALGDRETMLKDYISTVQRDGKGGVSESQRRDLLVWVHQFSLFFGLSSGTYVAAAALTDKFLEATRVKPEHADLVGVACLLIAAKQSEPADLQPTLRELSRNCDGAFSENDIERMEALVHKKLGGAVANLLAPLDFLDETVAFAAAAGAPSEVIATSSFEALTTNVMLSCTFHYELMSYRPSVLAVAALSLELARIGEADRFADVIGAAQQILEIPSWDLENCRARIARCLKLRPYAA